MAKNKKAKKNPKVTPRLRVRMKFLVNGVPEIIDGKIVKISVN